MNKAKYKEVVEKEFEKLPVWEATPETYPEFRTRLINFIGIVDEATEVFNMENGKKGS